MDFRGWIPPEFIALLVMGALIAFWAGWQVFSFLNSHVSIGWH